MALIPSTPADGQLRVQWVPTIANPAAPTVAEINASSAKDFSCYLTADGWNPGLDEATITDDRLCDTETFARPGRSSRSLSITYVTNPTAPTDDVAATTLANRAVGFFVTRSGLDYDDAFAAAQKVDVWPVQMGAQSDLAPEANSVLRITQGAFVTGPVFRRVAVAT